MHLVVSKNNATSCAYVQVGRILKRDKEKCRAMVQLESYEKKVFTLDYDSICHYVGDH